VSIRMWTAGKVVIISKLGTVWLFIFILIVIFNLVFTWGVSDRLCFTPEHLPMPAFLSLFFCLFHLSIDAIY